MIKERKAAFSNYLKGKYAPSLVNVSNVLQTEGSISRSLNKMDKNFTSIYSVEDTVIVDRLIHFIQSPPRGAMARMRPVQNMDLKMAFLNHYKQFLISPQTVSDEEEEEVFVEGLMKETRFFRRKRNRVLREECIKKYGNTCYVCGFDFEKHYGARGHGFIEVHHLHPMANYDDTHEVSVDDLRPLCSNCHSMIHKDPDHGLTDIDVFKADYRRMNSLCEE